MPFSRNIFSATSRPVRPLERGTLLYFANLFFSTRETSILIPKKISETNIIGAVISYKYWFFPEIQQICNHLDYCLFFSLFVIYKKSKLFLKQLYKT